MTSSSTKRHHSYSLSSNHHVMHANDFVKHHLNQCLTNFIFTTKTHDTLAAIEPLLPHLNSHPHTSVITLLQNGVLHSYDTIQQHHPQLHPSRFILGTTALGAYRVLDSPTSYTLNFTSTTGPTYFGTPPPPLQTSDQPCPPPLQSTLHCLSHLSTLSTLNPHICLPSSSTSTPTSPTFLIHTLRKLVANCCINPLTALHRVENGKLSEIHGVDSIIQNICKESSRVLQAWIKTTTSSHSPDELSWDSLYAHVLDVILITATNRSSMLQDISTIKGRRKKKTEIDSFNGWIIDLSQRLQQQQREKLSGNNNSTTTANTCDLSVPVNEWIYSEIKRIEEEV